MRKTALALAALLCFAVISEAAAQTYVRPYYRKDGTYVQPHYRSSPNRSYNDNWTVKPNVNPYTGQRGTRSPSIYDRPPRSNPYGRPTRRRSGYR